MWSMTAIIPTLNNPQGLTKLKQELDQAKIPTIIVDNSKHNRGFAVAVNWGAKQAQTEWLLILNDDVEGVTKEAIKQLSETAIKNKWSAISPILTNPNGEVENIGYTVLPIGKVRLNFDKTKVSDKDLDGLTAACLLIKRETFRKMGGFDESFFAYLEDVDLFLHLKQAGFHFGLDTRMAVVHHHMSTTRKIKGFKEKRDLINWWRIIFKHRKRFCLSPTTLPLMLIERGKNLSGWLKTYGP